MKPRAVDPYGLLAMTHPNIIWVSPLAPMDAGSLPEIG
jgi:hypothetical protein